jgi:hypothetical protein
MPSVLMRTVVCRREENESILADWGPHSIVSALQF